MADEKSSIFTEKASNKLRSPDDLDAYVRVTNPSIWVVIAACAVLLIGLFAWGFLGMAETNVATTATSVKGEVVGFLPEEKASKVHVGDCAKVGGELMQVESIGAVPLSRAEVHAIVGGDYLENTLVEDDWSYPVRFTADDDYAFAEGVPLRVSITVESVAPMSLLFKDVA